MERLTDEQRAAIKYYNRQCMIRHQIESKGMQTSDCGTSYSHAKMKTILGKAKSDFHYNFAVKRVERINLLQVKI